MAHRLNTNKQFTLGNGILAFAVIFVVVIFVYMSMRLQREKQEERHFIETYTISLVKGFNALKSPGHLIALSCRDKEEERRLLSILMDNNVNFKRSNSDIEIMSINAREQFYAKA